MQISLKWVNELVDIKQVNLNSLIDKLTLGGFEVEEILKVEVDSEKEIALDISATANRSDSLSIQGISLEICALLDQSPQDSKYLTKYFSWSKNLENLSKNYLIQNDCLGFVAITIENLTTLTSPKWLQNKLISSGLMPQNNLQDFQDYLMLETGYPFEFYDLEKIQEKLNSTRFNLNLVKGKDDQKVLANNQIEYTVNESILLVQADDLTISIGGMISNKLISSSSATTSLLIEGSIFNAAKIRQQSRILGMRTDRSSKYEKSIKNINLLEAFYRLISLLRIANPELICKFHTVAQPINQEDRIITLNYKTVKKVLGPIKISVSSTPTYISPVIITNALKRLNFKVEFNEAKLLWKVKVPNLRSDDIAREIDLIEEIGRLYGFDNFLTRLPVIKSVGKKDLSYQTRKKLTNCLLSLGLNELIQYSLVNEKEYIENEIKLINPLVKDYANLRSSLLPNLLKSVQKNVNQGNSILEGFEYGHTFSMSNSATIQETEKVAGIFGGTDIKLNWSKTSRTLNWFEAKGRIEQIFKRLNLSISWRSYIPIKEKILLHPYCSAELLLKNGKKIGIFGQVNPMVFKTLNIQANLYVFEFDFNLIQDQIKTNKLASYSEYSTYPKIVKDLSFLVDKKYSFDKLQKVLYLNGSKFLTDIKLLDEYSGKAVPDHQTSLCLQFIFQSEEGTLKNKKVEAIVKHLETVLITKFNVITRT